FDFLRPFDQRTQSLRSLVVLAGAAFTFLVFPVSRDTFFGDLMHLLCANLNFKRLHIRCDHGSVQRLVEIVARGRNPVLDAAGNGFRVVMDHSQSSVAMAYLVRSYDPCSDEIVNLVETDLLASQFLPD